MGGDGNHGVVMADHGVVREDHGVVRADHGVVWVSFHRIPTQVWIEKDNSKTRTAKKLTFRHHLEDQGCY